MVLQEGHSHHTWVEVVEAQHHSADRSNPGSAGRQHNIRYFADAEVGQSTVVRAVGSCCRSKVVRSGQVEMPILYRSMAGDQPCGGGVLLCSCKAC